ncbi:MAG TPA: hypothetical protein VMM35_01045 [Longimicrobiales bacterium]|nr:hypothetical protein [Longimicrobiales bacterium]
MSHPLPLRSGRLLAALALVLAACQDEAPTSIDADRLPPEPLTLSIQLPWSEFGSDLVVYGGYGEHGTLGEAIVARGYAADDLDANVLIGFGAYPANVSVRDAQGTLVQDSNISFYGGYFVAFLDTLASTNTGPVSLALGAVQTPWHAPTANWTFAFDTVADQRPWPEPGGGPVTPLATRDWDPAMGDSVQFFLDSTQVAEWSDPANAANGARIELLTAGERLQLRGGALRLNTRSSINPDTALVLTAQAASVTFLYDVDAAPPADGMRVGGVPAWRTVLDVAVPSVLNGPPELCAAVTCPFTLAPRHVSHAGLRLRTRRPPEAFQPTDSVTIDVRPVLSRAALPKSPLGTSLIVQTQGQAIAAPLFGAQEGTPVDIPITNYVKALLSGPDPAGRPPPTTLGLLATPEPNSFYFAEFYGPGPNEPVLELILTVSPPLELP